MRRSTASAALFAALIAASVAPRAAHAQFGGFIKRKIAEKVVDKAAEKVDPKADAKDSGAAANVPGGQRRGRAGRVTMAPTNDPSALGSELSADTLESVLRGMEAVAAKRRESEEARTKMEEVNRKVADLRHAHGAEIDAYNERMSTVSVCQEGVFRERARARGAEMDRRMKADPAFREHATAAWNRYMKGAMEAQSKGDSATAMRLQLEMYRDLLGVNFDPKPDTVAAVRKCGMLPTKSAALALADSLSRVAGDLNKRYREAAQDAANEGPARSGLSEQQFARARERIEQWYVTKAKGGVHFWTDREDALLEAQRARIATIMRAFGVQG
jgi:hypothetical protein